MPVIGADVHGIAVLDVHDGCWAVWQVSTASLTGSGRAGSTNAVVTDGFDERVFRSLTYNRPIFLTSRAQKHCQERVVLEATAFLPEEFLADCASWTDYLQGLFWAENDSRREYNANMAAARKEAKAAGLPLPEFQRRAPLQDIDWPAPPLQSVWESSPACEDPVTVEALRVANGCIQLLNYWQEIESDRLKKSRSYFKEAGGPVARPWPSQAPAPVEHV
ncbi:hypothetical protein [Paenarthrobacter ureafaciens]|uniref:hypothetical protein n=1 Tax=Paenarthrobacter ureafaciens TaxID=37931 RepID=UPI002DB73FB6|nr:hypothetical protein [Paenarthrobacter ureafaciens]MEC3853888.1 hypothetical protein [Paenarthrobacter ureafaciens]